MYFRFLQTCELRLAGQPKTLWVNSLRLKLWVGLYFEWRWFFVVCVCFLFFKRGVGYLCRFQWRPRSGLSLGFLFVYKLCLGEVFFSFPLPLPYHLSSSSYPNSLIGKLRRKTNTSPTVTEGAVKETFGQWFCGEGGGDSCLLPRVNTKGLGVALSPGGKDGFSSFSF